MQTDVGRTFAMPSALVLSELLDGHAGDPKKTLHLLEIMQQLKPRLWKLMQGNPSAGDGSATLCAGSSRKSARMILNRAALAFARKR